MEYMERQLELTEVFFEPPQAEVVRQLLLERGSLGNVRRAAAFYKLQLLQLQAAETAMA